MAIQPSLANYFPRAYAFGGLFRHKKRDLTLLRPFKFYAARTFVALFFKKTSHMLRLLAAWLLLLPLGVFGQNTIAPSETKVVSGTILLDDKTVPPFRKILAALPTDWLIKTDSVVTTDKTAVFSTPGATVMLAWLDYQVNPAEIQPAAGISWLWKNAEIETNRHKSQLVISILGDGKKSTDLYRLFTRVAAGCLAQTPSSSGVFMNSQYLLLAKGYYLETARNMGQADLPLYCWVYFGMLQTDGKSSAYTYGLSEFGLPEMEIVNSAYGLQDAHGLMYQVATQAVRLNKPIADGQVLDLGDGKKVTLRLSDSAIIRDDSKTLKIE
jgi:hypothetical protein